MVAVAIIALFEYERVSRDVVEQRDTELARVSAARLAEGLRRYSRVLQDLAAEGDVQSLETARLSSALEKAETELSVFDAGVVVYNTEGVVLWSQPFAAERLGTDIPVPSEFEKIRKVLRPALSDVFQDATSGNDVILVGVPIMGKGNEFKGVMAGLFTIRYSLIGATYAEVLEFKAGRTGFAYLVDGNGLVIYHQDGSLVGSSLAATVPVVRATSGETGALVTQDSSGQSVISGFAPVPGTDWGLITQERWETVVGPIRDRSRLLLGLLVVGGVLSAALIFIGIGRSLRPIKELTRGAQRIAEGDFEHTIIAKTGDEFQALAEQFNTMALSLKDSYAGLERKVAERTDELRQSNQALQTLIQASPLPIIAVDRDARVRTWNPAAERTFHWSEEEIHGRPLTLLIPENERDQARVDLGRGLRGEVLMGLETRRHRKDGSPVDVAIWTAPLRGSDGEISSVMGIIADLTELKRTEQKLRESEERLRTVVTGAPSSFSPWTAMVCAPLRRAQA